MSFDEEVFCCVYCDVHAQHEWKNVRARQWKNVHARQDARIFFSSEGALSFNYNNNSEHVMVSCCMVCKKVALWAKDSRLLLYPDKSTFEPVNEDLNDDIKKLYHEAVSIRNKSPRSACMLVRVAIEKFLKGQLGREGKLNTIIGDMAKESIITEQDMKMLDILRVVGNDAAHSLSDIFDDDKKDTLEIVEKLLKILNRLTEKLISEPKADDEFYNEVVSEDKQQGIENRGKP